MKAWMKSEHSFLSKFCAYSDHVWGDQYFWEQGIAWPKFNFIRIKNFEFDIRDLLRIKSQLPPKSSLNLKISIDAKIPNYLQSSLRFGGTPIAFTSTKASDLAIPKHKKIRIVRLLNVEELDLWWEINSDGRNREQFQSSPIFRALKDRFADSEFYISYLDSRAIGCVAVTKFDEAYNLWGLAVSKEYQNQGIMKEILHSLGEVYEGADIYAQTNMGSPVFNYLLSKNSTATFCIEKKYDLIH